jgi:hypothetical protein
MLICLSFLFGCDLLLAPGEPGQQFSLRFSLPKGLDADEDRLRAATPRDHRRGLGLPYSSQDAARVLFEIGKRNDVR